MKEEKISSSGESPQKSEQRPERSFLEIPPEILENLPDETRTAFFQAASVQGALPLPGLYAQYEATMPGAVERRSD